MPNWCNNSISIKTNSKLLYRKIKTHLETEAEKDDKGSYTSKGLFGLLYPEPDYQTIDVMNWKDKVASKGEAWWYWRIENWGTKWDVWSDDILGDLTCTADDKNREYEIEFDFDTAWSPPIEWLRYCEEKYKRQELTFHMSYFEGGMGFGGVYDTFDGDAYFEHEEIKHGVLNGTEDSALGEVIDTHYLTPEDYDFEEEEEENVT